MQHDETTQNASAPILMLYTGGTIGMQPSPEGWRSAPGFDAQIRIRIAQKNPGMTLPWHYQAMEPPIDSANMTQAHYFALRDAIVQAVEQGNYRGVLILHGTDTLAYSAAALSFLLLGLSVPVCLTGAMHPAREEDTDAWDNLFGALQWLDTTHARGVHVFFDGQLFSGTRVTKLFNQRRDAFSVLRQTSSASPQVLSPEWQTRLAYAVPRQTVRLGVLALYPGIDATALQAVVDTGVRGLVLELYGSGTGPADDTRFLEVLSQAHQQGVVLVGITQCPGGVVDATQYAAANRMQQAGVLPSGSMTREAALGKLLGLLGAGLSAAQVADVWAINICGEYGAKIYLADGAS